MGALPIGHQVALVISVSAASGYQVRIFHPMYFNTSFSTCFLANTSSDHMLVHQSFEMIKTRTKAETSTQQTNLHKFDLRLFLTNIAFPRTFQDVPSSVGHAMLQTLELPGLLMPGFALH